MNPELKYPLWQAQLQAAVLEFEPPQLREKLRKAESAISNRALELADKMNAADERRALADGLHTIGILRRTRLY